MLVWGGLAFVAWQQRERKPILIGCGVAALLYPLIAFTGMREVFFLLAGQTTEMIFAGIFLWRAMTGGFTSSNAERVAYGAAGWFLLGRNVYLAGGLVFSDSVRAWYQRSGSLGMENDYLRVAKIWGTGVESVGILMLLVALAVFPAVWWVTRQRQA